MSSPALFLDRDGTLFESVPGYIGAVSEARLMPEALWGLRLSRLLTGYKRFVVTNQAGVGKGVISMDQVRQTNESLLREVEAAKITLEGFYVCPHTEEAQCSCRKPEPGMLLAAAEAHDLDLSKSWMIGDSWRDMQMGHSAGCRTILLRCGVELTEEAESQADYVRDDLYAAIWLIGAITIGGGK